MKNYISLFNLIHQVNDYSAYAIESVCPDYKVVHILYLIAHDHLNQKTLAKKLGMTEPALSMKLRLLENDQLIEKIRSKKDKRHYDLVLTKKGEDMLNQNDEVISAKAEELLSVLSHDECLQLEAILSKLEH